MRIRTIKPEFFNHEAIYDLEESCKLPVRLAFVGLWCAADKEGRFKWEPRRLGVQILPYDKVDFSRVLDALATRGFVVRYASDTGEFGYIPSFARHQVINNRERESELPNPCDCKEFNACPTREPRDDHASKEEGKGKERKGSIMSARADELVEILWPMFPAKSRIRSSKDKLSEAIRKIKITCDNETIVRRLSKWALTDDWCKDGGQFAPGAHLWFKDGKYKEDPPELMASFATTVSSPLFPGYNPNK